MLRFLIENEIHLGGRASPPAGPASPKKLLEPSAAGIPTGGAWDGGYLIIELYSKALLRIIVPIAAVLTSLSMYSCTCPTPVSEGPAVLPCDLPHLK